MKQQPPPEPAQQEHPGPGSAIDPAQAECVDKLYREQRQSLLDRSSGQLGSRHDAEDVVQDVSLSIVASGKADTIRNDERYTSVAVRNEVIARAKRRARRLQRIQALTSRWTDEQYPSAEETALFKAQIDKLQQVVPLLSLRRREALDLVKFQELTYTEAAVRMGVDEGTVRNLVKQALDFCRHEIGYDTEE